MNIYIAGACAGLGLIVGALGQILNFNQLIMFALGIGLIIGCIFSYIKKFINNSVSEKKF